MEGNEEEDLLLSSFSLCHSFEFHLFYLSEYILVHYRQLGRPSSSEQGEPLLASLGPERRQVLRWKATVRTRIQTKPSRSTMP